MVAGFRWRCPGQWFLYVGDRSSLFGVVRRLVHGTASELHKYCCSPLEFRLRRILLSLRDAWNPPVALPRWRADQESRPDRWNVRLASGDGGRLQWWSKVAWCEFGVVCIDVKSHQEGANIPYPAVVEGNEAQDSSCSTVLSGPLPAEVLVPSGGLFANLMLFGRTVTCSPARAAREAFRRQAAAAWAQRPVQGLVPKVAHRLFHRCLDARLYASCRIVPRLQPLLLPGDNPSSVDLSGVFYRALRAVGGSWTEAMHSDGSLCDLAESWADRTGAASFRVCPLCGDGAGTPRHVVMRCWEMRSLADFVRDKVEAELLFDNSRVRLLDAAAAYRDSLDEQGRPHPLPAVDPRAVSRWPVLSAWRWLVPLPGREELLSGLSEHGGAPAAAVEQEYDLAYRGVMPRALGLALAGPPSSPSDSEDEEYACSDSPALFESESRSRHASAAAAQAPARVLVALLLGIRRIRREYAVRIAAWRVLAEHTLRPAPIPMPSTAVTACPAQPSLVISRRSVHVLQGQLEAWAGSAAGRAVVRELRWYTPSVSVLCSRLRRDFGSVGGISHRSLLTACIPLGLPVARGASVSWGPGMPTWAEAFAAWQRPCTCGSACPAGVLCCPVCHGGRALAAAALPMSARCRWCDSVCSSVCHACGAGLHFRGECLRWLRGASPLFRPDPEHPRALCPDCAWLWTRELSLAPLSSRSAHPLQGAAAHMDALATACSPGAGVASASRCSVGLNQRVARWVSRYLRRSRWLSVTALVSRGSAALVARLHLDGAVVAALIRRTVGDLTRSGCLWLHGSGRRREVRWKLSRDATLPSPPATRRGRRRRGDHPLDAPPPTRLRSS